MTDNHDLPKITLFLDIDQTILFQTSSSAKEFDYNFTVNPFEYKMKKRPYLDEFLDFCASRFHVYLFTARDKEFTSKIFNILNTPNKRILDFFTIDDFKNRRKDIQILQTSLERTLLIDDWSSATPLKRNLYVIKPYKGEDDSELNNMIQLLKKLEYQPDIRYYLQNNMHASKMSISTSTPVLLNIE